jgi:molybdenum cofactor cytidylyltransferase
VIDVVLSAWRNSQVSKIVVVLRGDDEQLIARCKDASVELARVSSPTADMKASVQAGLRYIAEKYTPAPLDAWLVAPADIPALSSQVIDSVLAAYNPAVPRPVVPTHQGRQGHPALFPWSFVEQVEALADSQGINALLSETEVTEVECAGAVPEDIDTLEDYGRST